MKLTVMDEWAPARESPPSRGRGLKLLVIDSPGGVVGRPPRGGVD